MIKKQFQAAVNIIEKNCNADDFSIILYRSDEQMIRYAQNKIIQNMSGVKIVANLSVAYGNRTGSATISSLDEKELKEMTETAQRIAKLNKEDPEFVKSASKTILPQTCNESESTEKLSLNEIGDLIVSAINNAEKKKAFVSGLVTKRIVDSYLKTKNGFEGFDRSSEFQNTMTLSDNKYREAKVERSVKDVNDYSINKELEYLNSRYDGLTEPQKIDVGIYNVILRPQAVNEFFSCFFDFGNRKNADQGLNAYHDSIGKNIFGKKFSLISKLDEKGLTAIRFGWDGVVAKNIEWIKNGIVNNLTIDRSYSKKIGEKSI